MTTFELRTNREQLIGSDSTMIDYTPKLEPERLYHIYNRANGQQNLFVKANNYHYFLRRYRHYVVPVADTFCYCLMPNHFHFLIRIKASEYLPAIPNLSNFISRQFSNLFNSYTKAFNIQQNRSGALFNRPFKRKQIQEQEYLWKLVRYIHNNPVAAGLCKRPLEWQHSSYCALMSDTVTWLMKEEVLSWFNDLETFAHYHSL